MSVVKSMESIPLKKRFIAMVDSKIHGKHYLGPFDYDTVVRVVYDDDKPTVRVRAWRKPDEGAW